LKEIYISKKEIVNNKFKKWPNDKVVAEML